MRRRQASLLDRPWIEAMTIDRSESAIRGASRGRLARVEGGPRPFGPSILTDARPRRLWSASGVPSVSGKPS